MAAYEVLLLNTAIPQIQAAQSGDTYVVPRDIAINATAIISANSATDALRITQTGAGNAILVEDSANPDSTPFVVNASGNVGVGTASPLTKLNVEGGELLLRGGQLTIGPTAGGNGAGAIRSTLNGVLGSLIFQTEDSNATLVDRMTLDSSGNLGLATNGTSVQWINSGNNVALNGTSGVLSFYTGTSSYVERARIASNGQFQWSPDGTTQAMTLDASGNWQLGTTTAYNANGFGRHANIRGTSNAVLYIGNNSAEANCMQLGWTATESYVGNLTSLPLVFLINNLEKARITSGGYFKASNTGNYVGVAGTYHEMVSDGTTNTLVVRNSNTATVDDGTVFISNARNTTNNTYYILSAYNTTAAAFKFRVADSGDVTNTNGTYGTISDAKMKTDIVDAGSQWSDIKALRFRKFKMKDDPSGLVQLGVVAQEVELTSPGLVDEHADRDAEGNDLGTTTKSVKTSVLLMKAAVALQEAMARIETLEAEVAALKGA